MQVNTSFNTSLQSSLRCSSNLMYPDSFTCFESTPNVIIFTVFTCASFLLLPLYILIVSMGLKRWRRQCSTTTVTTSHSDVITYNMVTMEIFGVLGSVFYCDAIYTCRMQMMMFGYYSLTMIYLAQTLFHCLTCIERYLAVVHPVTYLGLRQAGGVKVRNISIGCVWLLCFGVTGLTALIFPDFPTEVFYAIYACTMTVVSFCTFSALCVLIRGVPGKAGGKRERIDQSKQRAFYTIMIIMGTLVMRFCGLLVGNIVHDIEKKIGRRGCMALMFGFWLCLPSSLVLPLLFLHRARRLGRSSRNLNQSEN